MSEMKLPWSYRPHEYDDWGWIRDADNDIAACARGDKDEKWHDQHRIDKTDPYGKYATFIVKAVNAHDELIEALRRIVVLDPTAPIGEPPDPTYFIRQAQGIAHAALAKVKES